MNAKRILIGVAILAAAAIAAAAQDAQTDRVTVPLSNPGKPATVTVDVMMGSIKVVGYEGKDVIVEAKPREKKITEDYRLARTVEDIGKIPPPPPPVNYYLVTAKEKDKDKNQKDKAAGMKRIPIENSGLTVEESDNQVTVHIESFRRSFDVSLKVPYATSLKLNGTNLEDGITVENVNGEIEAHSANGGIVLKNVSGVVVTNATNGDVEVTLAKVTPDKPMSFVTMSGDVDVTLPADIKATLNLKSQMGDVYSDFDLVMKQMPAKSEESSKADKGRFRVSLDRAVTGAINGGGAEFKLQTFSGNIYIRKKKSAP